MRFINWDFRPAVLFKSEAFAMLAPGAGWSKVDFHDVWETGAFVSEEYWRGYFEWEFGPLDVSTIAAHAGEAPRNAAE